MRASPYCWCKQLMVATGVIHRYVLHLSGPTKSQAPPQLARTKEESPQNEDSPGSLLRPDGPWQLLRFSGLKHYHLPVVITQKTTCHTSTSGLAGAPAVLPVAIPPIGRKGQGRRTQGNTELRFRRHSFHLRLIYLSGGPVDPPCRTDSLCVLTFYIIYTNNFHVCQGYMGKITILVIFNHDIFAEPSGFPLSQE